MSSTVNTTPKRMFSLDVLRGLACMLVLIGHTPMPKDYAKLSPTLGPVITIVRRCGFLGVDLFFVLSGLLISGLLFKEIQARGSIHYPRFILRRGLKIWPSYFIGFGLLIATNVWMASHTHSQGHVDRLLSSILPNSIFIQNYLDNAMYWRWPHSWTIAIEEHFYTLLPLGLIALVMTRRLQWIPAAVGCICAAVLGMRMLAAHGGAHWDDIKYPTHLHIDALLFGVLLGYFFAYFPEKMDKLKRWWPLAIAFCLGVFAAVNVVHFKDFPLLYAIGFTVFYLDFGLLVTMAKLYPECGTRGSIWLRAIPAGLAFIGLYSYTIYLAHGIVFKLPYFDRALTLISHPAWKPCMFVVGSILGGIFLAHAVERPFLRLRDRWVPSASKAIPKPVVFSAIDASDHNEQSADREPVRRAA